MKYVLMMLLLLLPLNVMAGVNHLNGNFYITYTDIHLNKAAEALEITRTYNSKSVVAGWFGMGWGSDYETRLIVTPEGGVLIRENGSGALNWFSPEKAPDLDAVTARIVEEMRKKGAVADNAAAAALKEKLKGDADLRVLRGQQYNVSTAIPEGAVFLSSKFGAQEVLRTKEGFVRTGNGGGKTETFSADGRLVRVAEKGSRTVDITYSKGRVQAIADNHGQKIFMEWTPEGFVKSLWSSDKKTRASYHYQGKDLVKSVDVDSNRFVYGYDDKHNLTSVSYEDGRKLLVEYDPKSSHATKVTDKDGGVTEYRYGENPKNPDLHYWTEVVRTSGNTKTTNRYEYESRVRADGTTYSYRVVTDIDGEHTETVYSEFNQAPLKIVRNDTSVEFEYNSRGSLVQRKDSNGEFVRLEYHPTLDKIVRVENNEGWSAFVYDTAGNLINAKTRDGKQVDLSYDAEDRIATMIDSNAGGPEKRTLTFKYNRLNKPTEIAIAGLGAITVTYDDEGEILDVDSVAGHEMALQVTEVFQNLLAVIKPSGVKLGL